MKRDAPAPELRFGAWAWAAMAVAALLTLYPASARYRDPGGERLFKTNPPGGYDFQFPYNGARGLLLGIDPYLNAVPRLDDDPWRHEPPPREGYHQFYLPTHLLLYVPLAWAGGESFRDASRLWFDLNVFWLVLLALACWRILRVVQGITDAPVDVGAGVGFLLLFLLAGNQGVAFALERGQSDIFGSMLCWAAVLGWLRGERATPVFLATFATLLKGYALLFALGLVLLGLLDPRSRKAVLGGGVAAVVLLVGPVAHVVPQGVAATVARANMFVNSFMNQSFASLAYTFSPALAGPGRLVLGGLAGAVTALCWWALVRASRERSAAAEGPWLVLFATAALATMLGVSNLSMPYCQIMVLPGALLVMLLQERFPAVRGRAPIGLGLCVVGALLFVFDVGSRQLSPSSVALLGVLAVCATLAAAQGTGRGAVTSNDAAIPSATASPATVGTSQPPPS